MKKLVTSLAIVLVTAVFTSYSNAQCIGCSQGGAPSFAQPLDVVQPIGTRIYGSVPVFNSAPIYNWAPAYDSGPVYSSPIVSAPVESFPVAAPVYSGPQCCPVAAPVGGGPCSNGCCCGGGVSGGIGGQPIYDNQAEWLPVGAFLDGGIVIGRAGVGETVVPATPTAGSTESVSPPTPVAQGQGSPTPEESKEMMKKAPQEDDGT